MLTEPQMIAAFDEALRSFDLDPESCREGADWWRFKLGGVAFQGGVHRADVRIFAAVCKLDSGVDLDALYAATAAAEAPGLATFKETDNYLNAAASLPFAGVSQERIERAIRDCLAAATSPAADALKSRWRAW